VFVVFKVFIITLAAGYWLLAAFIPLLDEAARSQKQT
jgi:hypothetical protein